MSGLHDFATHVMHSCKNIEWLTLRKETSISRAICQKLSESNNSLFIPSDICVNYVEEPFIYQLYTVLALPFSLVISVKERMKTGLKLPSRASVVTEVTGFVLLSFCQHAANGRDKPAFA